MDDLKRMAVFATVVTQGSMSAAARVLGMSPSAVSQQVRALEAEAGVRLLHRTTRKISLTDIGQRVYTQCAALHEAAERARDEWGAEGQLPSGELRLSAPIGFARHAAPALSDWLGQHRGLRLRLMVDDAPTDLVQSRVDVALRFGRLNDSGWVARRLGRTPQVLCASPAWLQAWGPSASAVPQHPGDLLKVDWIEVDVGQGESCPQLWRHTTSGEIQSFEVLPRLHCNQRSAVQQLCEAGLGVAMLSAMDVSQELRQQRLVRLLPEWDMGRIDLWALTPQRAQRSAKVRQVLEVLQAYFRQLEGVQE